MSRAELRLALAGAAVLLAAADTYVVVVALPDIMTGVGVGADQLGRAAPIVSVFLLGYVAMLPTVGRLADVVGRLPVLAGCLLLFALGSLVTATAHTLPAVVIGRGLQGVGAGGLVPATLALVADAYPVGRRGVPLGLVGAAQETGALLGPLYGALVLALAGWRTIFWVNLVAGVVLAAALVATRSAEDRARVDVIGIGLALLAVTGVVLLLTAPSSLADNYTLGVAYDPVAGGGRATSPLAIGTAVAGTAAALRLANVAALRRVLADVDGPGAVLVALGLGGIVLAFSVADPQRHAIVPNGPYVLAGSAVCFALFAVREARARHPLVPMRAVAARPVVGGLAVSLFVGAALIAALVDVPVFGRLSGRDQLGAALLLVRLLAAVPVGAALGGLCSQRIGDRITAALGSVLAAAGLAVMTRWHLTSPSSVGATVALVVAGLGFGITIAPVNASVLAATESTIHGLASALVVVARTVGMLVGLSALTAIGLSRFAHVTAHIRSPLVLCPQTPTHCPAYDAAVKAAAVSEVHVVFIGAAACAAVAGVFALTLLRKRPGAPPRPEPVAAPA